MQLDQIDINLIKKLQVNSKMSTKQLALEENLSATAIYERIKKLEKNGIISNYVAVVNKEKVQRDFIVLCKVKLIQHNNNYISKFEKEVKQFHEVLDCYNISGDYDYILKIVVKNMDAYRTFLKSKLTSLDYIGSTYSTFVINEVKNTFAIAVEN